MRDGEADDRLAGAALAGASIFSLVAMAHHPTDTGHPALAQVVHGTLIAVVLVIFAGYVRFALRLGLERFSNVLALVTYGAGVMANILAATINGFVVAGIVAHGGDEGLVRLCWELNQALAYGAVYATSVAFLIWSFGLAGERGAWRIAGLAGVVAGIAPTALLLMGTVSMNVAGAFVIFGLQAAFGVCAGAALTRGETE